MNRKEENINVAETAIENRVTKTRPINLGWTTDQVEAITTSLNDLLANYTIHYQRLRNYHWSVKGPDFFDLHEEFEMQYSEAVQNIDDIAERIRVFGKTPLSTLREYLDTSELKETGSQLSSDQMVKELLNDYRILLQYMFSVVETASENGDSGTEEIIKRFITKIEKHHWMLTAFITR
jgi:starvation-inducible DNA-binding protein